ncbi:Lhr family helicase [Rhabdothermincola salaria]|uniref:Lhr family helicase n=1 Tax=Rhabdothermincola salaria TaxID=2903142 RepID=UPI001E651919|nr:DEAD/DEAH box helicase [Rhabdothermincola salaria]
MPSDDPLGAFSGPVRAWFSTSFAAPTAPQAKGWPAISAGDHSLVLAPTGSGKTLAAFLWGLDRLVTAPTPPDRERRTRLVYVSPLRALAVDIEKNLRAPLAGIGLAAERLGEAFTAPTVAMRTGDTPADERRRMLRHPPDLLITTPESLYLMLTSQARETLRGVEAVIIDEIHALAPTKRGAHLSLTLERLDAVTDRPVQRIGLSATQRPLDEIARFLGGHDPVARSPRPVTIVDAGVRKPLELEVVVPVEDMGALGEVIEEPVSGPAAAGPVRRSIWPSMHPRLLELVQAHRSTIIFVNARRLAERLATRLNELHLEGENRAAEAVGTPPNEGAELVMAHHGSLSRERRLLIEDRLKRGELKGLVATSSLELGIDMGAVDLVVQVESPGAVSRGLQRVGRAGHQVGEPSRGKLFPKHRNDLVEAAVVVDRMQQGLIEHTRYPRNPLDVLAQQIVAMVAMDDWSVDDLTRLVHSSANYAELSEEVLANVLDLLAGRYPSEEFGELRPRIVWDRIEGTVRARAGAQRLAVTSGGTIVDRGLYGVFLPDGTRVGELDEEMVYESRPGETFLLGASTWRIEDITHERVVVSPAPGQPGKMPFWHGDGPGRPLELGRALGEFVRTIRSTAPDEALTVLAERHALDPLAAANLLAYLDEQSDACAGVVPDDRTVVVERFRDEIGDWRVCVHTPFGAQVHAPWGMALQARLAERWGVDVELIWSDDGIVLRLPEAIDSLPVEELTIDPDEIDELVIAQLPQTAMFAGRFRECAARALLLPRRRPDRRTPLWQQRQRAADLLAVAARYPDFPILLETTRECLNDVFDLPALREVLADLRSRRVRVVAVDTPKASPFAQSLLFGWVSVYMYEGDAPLAERRAAALALDRDLLRELLGAEELRDLLDPAVLADLELELQRLTDGRRARDVDEAHDLLRRLGPLSRWEIESRSEPRDGRAEAAVGAWLDELVATRRAIAVVVGGEERLAAAEDAARLRDALGVALPPGLPAAFTDPVAAPLVDLVARFARTHGPFLAAQVAARYGVGVDRVGAALDVLEGEGRLVRGEFRPDGVEREWVDDDVLRQLRRRSLAALRREVEPVEGDALARFLPGWQGVGSPRRGVEALVEALGVVQGAAVPASVLEADVLAARVPGYQPSDLDALMTAGEVVWVGAGAVGAGDGRVRLLFRDQAALLVAAPDPEAVDGLLGPDDDGAAQVRRALHHHLGERGASFWPDLVAAAQRAGAAYDDPTVLDALWELVWAGLVTNDSLAPLRSLVAGGGRRKASGSRARRGANSATRAATLRSLGRRPNLGRPAVGSLSRLGPPAGAGRWSSVATLLDTSPTPTEAAHATALQLLERHGVLTREAVLGEGVEGGFAGVYQVLKALEERGQVRRGYFVAGLGAAQFALPGAVDRLRAAREVGEDDLSPVVLAATDPAQPFGLTLPWPASAGRPARSAGAFVVLVAGEPVVHLERGGRTLSTFPSAGRHAHWAAAIAQLVHGGRVGRLEITRIDGEPAGESPLAEVLRDAGFADGYRGLTLRSSRARG